MSQEPENIVIGSATYRIESWSGGWRYSRAGSREWSTRFADRNLCVTCAVAHNDGYRQARSDSFRQAYDGAESQ